MFLKSLFRFLFYVSLAFVSLNGCATGQSRVWVDENVSFSDYKLFEIQPVFNATGGVLNEQIPIILTSLLKEQFKNEQLLISDSPQSKMGILIVKCNIVVYEGCRRDKLGTAATGLSTPVVGGSVTTMGKSTCILRTQLIDKSTNRVVAEIYTTKVVGACFTTQNKGQWLLEEVATDIFKKVVGVTAT